MYTKSYLIIHVQNCETPEFENKMMKPECVDKYDIETSYHVADCFIAEAEKAFAKDNGKVTLPTIYTNIEAVIDFRINITVPVNRILYIERNDS